MRISSLALMITTVAFLGCGEDIDAHYATYAELQRAGSGPKSWMPEWLPPSATDIYDSHNLDTNATLIAFSVPDPTPSLLNGCRPVGAVPNPGSAPWWPNDREFASMQHFACEERMTFSDGRVEVTQTGAAIDRRSNRVYYWR